MSVVECEGKPPSAESLKENAQGGLNSFDADGALKAGPAADGLLAKSVSVLELARRLVLGATRKESKSSSALDSDPTAVAA